MQPTYVIIFLLLIMNTLLVAQQDARPAHHTDDGFRNPFPTFEERGFGDFIQWTLVERIKGNKPEKPDEYFFETVENDGAFLRSNKDEFTVTWIGHSTLLVQIEGMNILTDPIWSDRCSPYQFVGPKRHVAPGVKFEDLPKIDIVIISHNHYDHLDRLTIEKLGNEPFYLVPLGIGAFLEDLGITNYQELDWWDSIKFNGLNITCSPAQHFSNRGLFDRNKTLWCGWIISGKENRFYFAGDTGYFPGFKEIAEKYGPFDFAAIPIGAYLPRWFMGPVHLSPDEAVKVFREINSKFFVPIHWGTFELADEPLDQPPKELLKEIQNQSLNSEQFLILKHGETKIIKEINISPELSTSIQSF